LFKGFVPDENGTNLDDPQANKGTSKVASGAVIKDCAECPEMVVLPEGSFLMGSNTAFSEQQRHQVTIRNFLIGKTEVTQRQWQDVMGINPSHFSACGWDCPVDNVRWSEVQQFISKLNQKTGQKYRLPSEAEWEYAARAGTTTEWSFGNDESKVGNYAVYSDNSGSKTQVVGQKLPNAFGIYDVHGNVREYVQDCWHETYAGAPSDGSAWTTGCGGSLRILRGGSWSNVATMLRSTARFGTFEGVRTSTYGFRLARDL
jgi:formylglycine-generating enzyme required for sulfatase activity